MAWTYNPSDFTEQDFAPIPVGDHRVRISNVVEKTFKSGNEGYEITFDVSGYGSKLWHYIVLDHSDVKKTNQKLGSFFESFGITDYDLGHYRNWVGKVGGVKVRHEEYNGDQQAKVHYCLSKKNQEKLPAAKFNGTAAPAGFAPLPNISDSELPF